MSETSLIKIGSLARGSGFNRWSDIDIAAWGIPLRGHFPAIGAVMDLDIEVPVNLVDANTCRPGLLAVIEWESVDL